MFKKGCLEGGELLVEISPSLWLKESVAELKLWTHLFNALSD